MDISSPVALGTAALLDKLGLGTSKKTNFFLPHTTLQQVRKYIHSVISVEQWSLTKEETVDNHLVFSIQVGQWGISVSGAQRLVVALIEAKGGVQASATSKSVMGQLVDWGANQKNIDKLVDSLKHPKEKISDHKLLEHQNISKSKPLISPKFFVITVIIFIVGFIGQLFLNMYSNNQRNAVIEKSYEQIDQGNLLMQAQLEARECQPEILPDKIKIGFRSDIDGTTKQSLLQEIGAINCEECQHDWLLICTINPKDQFKIPAQYSNNPDILFIAP